MDGASPSDNNPSATPMPKQELPVCVAALYKFVPVPAPADLRDTLAAICSRASVKGTLLVAPEGINGTIAGFDPAIADVLAQIRSLPGLTELEAKTSRAPAMPFFRMKVRIKREIVTMGQPGIDPTASVGRYVAPADWNALISDPNTITIDTRNDYETGVGTFLGAVDPGLKTFRDFPAWFRNERRRLLGEGKQPKVAMFCTGGIRCEKSTAFLKSEGVEDVYHLQGGILKYLEQIPEAESLWEGECFVFDQRVTVAHGLKPGSYDLCHACRRPLSENDILSPLFETGVQCARCHDERSEEQRSRYRERQMQETRAAAFGKDHIGAVQRSGK
ncbi:rhodanese-related sulfurtransferase [Altererythrobacter aquiaggeris]|uniref:oxygen-dependent tRNA uridine(34) hydroxylase TrhO n=1 Tax=Aestuarierythrobacter aquiaggeris TaxID=1898396 RepID=UPI00301AE99C